MTNKILGATLLIIGVSALIWSFCIVSASHTTTVWSREPIVTMSMESGEDVLVDIGLCDDGIVYWRVHQDEKI